MLLCISTERVTLADSALALDSAQRKPLKGGQKEHAHREGHAVLAKPVKNFRIAGDLAKHDRWPVNERQPER